MKMLEQHLTQKSMPSVMTREPGGTEVGDLLRDLILQKRTEAPTARTELLMYEASRAQHVSLVIRPQLALKKWVLCDRFSASSVAFQGGGRGISTDQVEWLNAFATENLIPDLTILLDVSVEESRKRRSHRSDQTGSQDDRIESEADSFHERVRQGFLDQARKSAPNWLVLDASQTPDQLFQILLQNLRGRKWLT